VFDLASRADRARVYEVVLQEGRPVDILAYVDGALLIDLWDEMVLPPAVRSAWAPIVRVSLAPAA
jgi:glucose/arabinose dehydrogenase